ncbi:MAG: class I SAM-dependent methyltransferase [Anaerolineae bacterium]
MTSLPSEPAARITTAILASAKYCNLAPSFVRHVVEREWLTHPLAKEAEQAARRKLHQVAAAYWLASPRYARWLAELAAAAEAGGDALQAACRTILASHASTRERLPILHELYQTCLADLAPLHSVLDVACGLHPLASPWMSLAPGARYIACDVYSDLAAFLQQALILFGLQVTALGCDVLTELPAEPVQVALLLKALPCLEQLEPRLARELISRLPADHVIVSFPAHSLSGGKRHMPAVYEAHFREIIDGTSWRVQRYLWPSELVFRVDKS